MTRLLRELQEELTLLKTTAQEVQMYADKYADNEWSLFHNYDDSFENYAIKERETGILIAETKLMYTTGEIEIRRDSKSKHTNRDNLCQIINTILTKIDEKENKGQTVSLDKLHSFSAFYENGKRMFPPIITYHTHDSERREKFRSFLELIIN